MQLDHNLVLASPQWGLKLQGNATTGEATVHHNRVIGTKALVANGYMFGLYKPAVDVFENEGAGESRGLHLDGVDGSGTSCRVHDNVLRVQDQPNAEYPDFHWVHGIKLEGATGTRIDRNLVVGTADPTHGEVRALDLDLSDTAGVVIEQNRVHAVSTTPTLRAHALEWSSGTLAAPNDVTVRRNVFRATDRLIDRSWGARRGGLLRDNVWVRDLSLGTAHPFLFEYFDNSDTLTSAEHRLLDPLTTEDLLAVDQWGGAGPYASTREWTLGILAVDAGGGAGRRRARRRPRHERHHRVHHDDRRRGLRVRRRRRARDRERPRRERAQPVQRVGEQGGRRRLRRAGHGGPPHDAARRPPRRDRRAGHDAPGRADGRRRAARVGVARVRAVGAGDRPVGHRGLPRRLGGEPVLVSDVNDAFVAGLAPGATASVTVSGDRPRRERLVAVGGRPSRPRAPRTAARDARRRGRGAPSCAASSTCATATASAVPSD